MTTHFTCLPIALRLDRSRALVVGGGQIAAAKLRLLLGRCAEIHVWARDACSEIVEAAAAGKIVLHAEDLRPETVERENSAFDAALWPGENGFALAFVATDDRALNAALSALARKRGVPVCAVDDPALSSFITPALVERSPVQIAITTGGASPVLARRLRQRLEAELPAGLGRAASFMGAQRDWMKENLPDVRERRRAWEDFLDGPGFEAALAGDEAQARQALETRVASRLAEKGGGENAGKAASEGEVWLVGAGPGDPDLLTLGALRLMQNADSVLYDRLVSDDIMDRVRRDAERVYVGKASNRHTLPQKEIHAELLKRAKRGERVLRLKGGDPFIFGRGGEEMEALLAEGVTVRVMPGITAASGCGSAAGIPLTHRDCAQSCVFLTGHPRADGTLDLPWDALARKGQTLAIYMGLGPLAQLCARLQEHGLPPEWPVAVIQDGTRPTQRVVTATLADIAEKAAALQSPALVIVGEVVAHRGHLGCKPAAPIPSTSWATALPTASSKASKATSHKESTP